MGEHGRFKWARWVLIGAVAVLAVVGAGYAVVEPAKSFHAENGPLEMMQVGVWALSSLVAIAGVVVRRGGRERWWLLWLAVIAALAAAREFDLHTLANPEHAGAWGVRYRLDWWVSASAPVGPRVLWAVVFAAIGGLLLVPAWLARLDPGVVVRGLRAGYAPFWLMGLAAFCMGMGWIADDVLRPVRHVYTDIQPLSQGAEETFELWGAAAFFGAVWMSLRTSLPGRVA